MSTTTKLGALLCAGVALGAPAAAGAAPRGDDGVPSRIATKLQRAEKALDRAQERADDGNADGAVRQLTAVRRNLAAAEKAALRRTTADSETGVASDAAVTRGEHDVVAGAVDLLDGATGDLADAAVATLDAAADGRDGIVTAIAALDEDARSDYGRVLDRVARATVDEADDIADALSDDELTDDAKAALSAASDQVTATGTAASAAVVEASSDDADAEDGEDGDRPCPERGEGGDAERRGPGGPPQDGAPSGFQGGQQGGGRPS